MSSPTQSTEVPAGAMETLAQRLYEEHGVERPTALTWSATRESVRDMYRQDARAHLEAAAPAIRNQERQRLINDPVRISLCNACGYVDEPSRSSCANCGAQMQYFSKSLAGLAAQSEHQRLKEALLGEEALRPLACALTSQNFPAFDDARRLVEAALNTLDPSGEGE